MSTEVTAASTVSPFRGRLKAYSSVRGLTAKSGPSPIQWYAAALVLATAGLAYAVSTNEFVGAGPLWMLVLLGAAAALAERQSVQVGRHLHTSVSVLPIMFTAVVFGPQAAMVVAACALLPDLRPPYTRWLVWTASRMLPAGIAGLVAAAALSENDSFARFLAAVTVAVSVEGAIDLVLVTTTVRLRHRGTSVETLYGLTRLLVVTVPLFSPLVAVLAYAYIELSPWTVLFFIAPMLAAHKLVALYQEQRRLAERLSAANYELERANLSFASALVATLDARDRYTAGHSAAVAIYARDIAVRLGLPSAAQDTAHLAGLLHDIGKIGLPAGILEKEGPLTSAERRQMEQHSVIGARILENVAAYSDIAVFVRHHHERYDGAGYPDGVRGDDIPIIARIIGVADAYNAMTSGRPYRDALPTELARERLRMATGSQFDPAVVAAFESILDEAPNAYHRAARADFSVEAQRHPALIPVPGIAAA